MVCTDAWVHERKQNARRKSIYGYYYERDEPTAEWKIQDSCINFQWWELPSNPESPGYWFSKDWWRGSLQLDNKLPVKRLNCGPGLYPGRPNEVPLPSTIRSMLNNGYHPKRSGDIQILRPRVYWCLKQYRYHTWFVESLWFSHTAALVRMGYQKIKPWSVHDWHCPHYFLALLKIQVPSGCIGHVIEKW